MSASTWQENIYLKIKTLVGQRVRESSISELFSPETLVRIYIPATILKAGEDYGVLKRLSGDIK